MAASSSTVSTSNHHYEVFINHRGPDVKNTFASHLYRRLLSYGLRIFLDQPELKRGDGLTSQIKDAIRSASVHVAIFSAGYAESVWCLNELLQMLDSKATIIPVFYKVKPNELRWTRARTEEATGEATGEGTEEATGEGTSNKKKSYAEALAELEKKTARDPQTHEQGPRYDPATVEKWRNALARVADISGFELDACNGDEGELVDKVVERVLKIVKKPAYVAKYPTGLADKVEDFESSVLLQQQRKPQILGIVGLGGVGKTTLAKEFYNSRKSEYHRSCFLFDVRSNPLNLSQTKLLNSLTGSDNPVGSVDEGIGMLESLLSSTQAALVIIDDVDHVDQLDALLPHQTNLQSNSLVLITSRNKHVLTSRIEKRSIYNLKGLNRQHSRELFCSHAFHRPYPIRGFESLVEKYLDTCNGLPLSLKVFGALLYGEDISYFEEQLESLEQILPTTEIHQRFKISYDSLSKHEQEIFLDIACFLRGENKNMAIRIWDGSGWKGRLGFGNLENKSLVEVDSLNKIHMHDHLRDMGREIAEDSRLPRRLWRWTENTIDELPDGHVIPVRGIRMDLREYNGFVDDDAFGGIRMKRLQLLDIEDVLLDNILPKAQSSNLIWLRWEKCPYSSLPSSIPMKNLRVLHVSGDKLETLWEEESQAPLQLRELEIRAPLWNIPKSIGKLKHLEQIVIHYPYGYQYHRRQDVSLPEEFCHLQSLKALVLRNWSRMKSLPECFGSLTNLQHIDLYGCSELERLPDSFCKLINLQYLDLGYCYNLTMSSEILGNIITLKYINLKRCGRIEVLPLQVVHQRSLEQLYLKITNLKELPSAIGELSNLEILHIGGCMDTLPPSLGDLRNLKILTIKDGNQLKCLPASIGQLNKLTKLRLQECPLLDTLPDSIGQLNKLTKLIIQDCPMLDTLPASIGQLNKLTELIIDYFPLLDTLPPSLGDLRNLKSLDISYCMQLKCLPASIGLLSQLTFFYVYDCPLLDTLPPSLGDLRNLKNLDIKNCNQLKCLPDSLGQLNQLTGLQVGGCPLLDTLPPSLGDLRNLEKLCIRECKQLKCLPDSLGQLNKLTGLTVMDCPLLDTLPPSLGDLRNLEKLWIRECKQLKCLPDSLGQLNQLTELMVVHCPLLDTLPPSLGDLRNLKNLNIQNCNQLKCLPDSLGQLNRLIKLIIEECPLLDTLLPSLGDLRNLKNLNIQNCNQLKCLPDSLGQLNQLTELTVVHCALLDTLPPSLGDLTNCRIIWET